MSVIEVGGEFVRLAPHVKGVRDDFDARKLWRESIIKVKLSNATGGLRPMYPIERLQDLRVHFLDSEGELRELDEDEFVDIFSHVLKSRQYSRHQLAQWFRDIDVDVSNRVSWDEFTSFMIYQATVAGETNQRAREFVYDPNPVVQLSKEHKDVVRRVVSHQRSPYYISAGFDGLIKFWRPKDTQCVHTINNGSNSAARGPTSAGMQAYVSPIVDLVINTRGTAVFACAADKTINVYDPQSFALSRRYLGTTSTMMDSSLMKKDLGSGEDIVKALCREKDTVETYTLRNMDESPSSCDVASPLGRDVLMLGMANGEVMMYSAAKQSANAELLPLKVNRVHQSAITKLRYIKPLEAIVTSSWDTTVRLTCPETSRLLNTLDGGEHGDLRHTKTTVDFTFSNSLRLLASVGCDRSVMIWNPMMPSPLACLRGHNAMLQAITFDETDGHLISLDADNCIRVWDLRMYQSFQTISPGGSDAVLAATTRYNTLTYDSTRSKLVCAGNRLTTWTVRRALSFFPANHIGHTDSVLNVTYVPSTSSVVSCDTNLLMSWSANDGRRNTLWDTECGPNNICCTEVDEMNRRVFVAFKDGSLKVFNYRNGQLLRETDSPNSQSEPIRVLHLTNRDMTSRLIAVVTAHEVIMYNEMPDVSGMVSKKPDSVIHAPKGSTFCSATVFPSAGNSTTSALVVGTTDGSVIVYSSTTGITMSVSTHPVRLRTRQHSRRQGGYKPIALQAESFLGTQTRLDTTTPVSPGSGEMVRAAVEDIVYIGELDLFATVVGDNCIFFWDLRHNSLKFTYATCLVPEECLLCLATNSPKGTLASPQHSLTELSPEPPPGKRYLISSCDNGFVYIRDISRLPTSRCATIGFDASQIVLLRVFRGHNAPITRLLFVHGPKLIITMSTTDTLIKEFAFDGSFIGYFGQEKRWQIRHRSTFGADTLGAPQSDRCPMPRPMTSGALRTGTSQGGTRRHGTGLAGSRKGQNSRSRGTPTHKQLFSAANFVMEGSLGATAAQLLATQSGVPESPSAAGTASGSGVSSPTSLGASVAALRKPPLAPPPPPQPAPSATTGGEGDTFMTQFIALPPLPIRDVSAAAFDVDRRSPLQSVEGMIGPDDEPTVGQHGLQGTKRRTISMASAKPPAAKPAPALSASPQPLPQLASPTGPPSTFRFSAALGKAGLSSRFDLRASPNSPHVYVGDSPVPVVRAGLKPILNVKYRKTGGALHATEVSDSRLPKPMTPAVVNEDSVRGAPKKQLTFKWKKKRLPPVSGVSGSPLDSPSASSLNRAHTSLGFDASPAFKPALAVPVSGSPLVDLRSVPVRKAASGADGASVIGDSDTAYLFHLKRFQQAQGTWEEHQNVALVRDILNPCKGEAITSAMETNPKGWVGRAASLLEMKKLDTLQNPLAPKKKLKNL